MPLEWCFGGFCFGEKRLKKRGRGGTQGAFFMNEGSIKALPTPSSSVSLVAQGVQALGNSWKILEMPP